MAKIILHQEQQTPPLRKYTSGYHERLKDSDPETYNALLRARNHLNYIKHSERIKQSQKKYYNKEENRKKIIETATTWISEHPVQHSFNKAHSRFLTFVKGSSVAKLIKDPSIENIYHQDLLIIKQVMADYIETVEYPSDIEWDPLVKVIKLPKNIDKDIRSKYNVYRTDATRWAAPMTKQQFSSKSSAYFRINLHAEYLKRLYNDFAILNSRIEELGIKQ
ncbi:hypothetical protein ACLUX0_08505 [Limosilactobacillus mucosae]